MEWKLATKVEYTARETPQHNGLVEVGIATQAQLARAMFNDANIDSTMQLNLAKECLSLANKNCNLAVIEFNNQQVTQYKAVEQEIPIGLRICAHLVRLELSKLAKMEN